MPHIAPVPVLPTAVASATTQKMDAHIKRTAQESVFSQLFREHVAPQPEIGEAPLSSTGQTVAGFSPTTKDLIPKRSSTKDSCLPGSPADLVSADSYRSESLVHLHAGAGGHSARNETPAGRPQIGDIASTPLAASKTGGTGPAPSTTKDSKTKRDQGTPSVATTIQRSPSLQVIPQSVQPAAPLVISSIATERVDPPSSSVEGHVQPSSATSAQTAIESKNQLRDETSSIPDQAPALGPRISEDQTAPAAGADSIREAAPARADGASSKEGQEPQTPAHSSVAPHPGYISPERNSKELTAPVASSANGPHPVQVQSPLSPAQPTNQVPAPITPSAASAGPTPNLYDKMDQGASPAVLHSGAQHVVVGVHDPNFGWLEIKTQNVAGHVDATLVTASGQAHTSLAGQLPSIAEYLQQRELRIGTLAVQHHMPSTNGGVGTGNGSASTGTGAQNSNHYGSGHREEGAAPPPSPNLHPRNPGPKAAVENHQEFQPVSYISVRA